MKKLLPILLLPFIFFNTYGQISKGKEFWLSFMENVNGNGQPVYSLLISSDVNTSGTISIPYTGFSFNYTVTANQTSEIYLPTNIYNPIGDETIFNFGVKVTALDSVSVYAFHHKVYFSESSQILPVQEIGSDYIVLANKDFTGNSPSEFIVEATEDSTVVEITPSTLTLSFRSPGVPFTKLLNKGQVIQIQAYGDLTGSAVKSLNPQKKIAVFAGAMQADIYCAGADDHLYDQNYPVNSWGNTFIIVPFKNQGGDVFKIVAANNSTQISFNGSNTITLNAGQYRDTLINNAVTITSTNPISIAQFNKSTTCNQSNLGDPAMVVLTPNSLNKHRAIFKSVDGPNSNIWTPNHFVNIVTKTSSLNALTLDNNNISTSFNVVPFNTNYSFAQISLAAGNHVLKSDSGFNAVAYGFGSYNAYAFHLGYDIFWETATSSNDLVRSTIKINISPNPSSGIFTVTSEQEITATEIYNVLGELISPLSLGRGAGGEVEINLSSQPKGIYFCTITTVIGTATRKIVIQ